MPRDPIADIVRDIVAKHPDHSARGLARMVVEASNGAITLEPARTRVRKLLGQAGYETDRKRRKAPFARPPRRPGHRFEMPASKAEPWTPHVLEVVGRVGILSDIHVPYHDETALRAAVDQLRGDTIDALVLNGDIADFYTISRYIKDPRKRNFKAEITATREMLGWIRGQFPEIPVVFKCGNHEERWKHWLWQHAPEISDEPEMGLHSWLHLERHGMTLVEDQRPIMLGKLPVLHGHEKGKGISSPVNQARGAFLRLHHTVLEGHGHRTSGHCEPDMWGSEVFCWSTGCLCDLRPEYARINKWNHGFAIVEVHKGGEFDVENLRITADGKVRSS